MSVAIHRSEFSGGVAKYLTDSLLLTPKRAIAVIADPAAAFARWRNEQQAAVASIRTANPLPELRGSIDIIPSEQAALLANGLDYRPRPIFQEYAVYTPGLIAANRDFYLGDRAPESVLFRLATIDERLPALMEGPLWPVLLGRYDPARVIPGNLLVLERRSAPLPIMTAEATEGTVALGEVLTLPADDRPLFMTLKIERTLLGRALETLFKLPMLNIEIQMAAGGRRRYRLIPGIAREGFVVSPLVESNRDFLGLALADPSILESRRVATVRIAPASRVRWLYRRAIAYQLAPLDPAALRNRPPERVEGLMATMRSQRALHQLAASTAAPADHVALQGEELYAHAPVSLSLPATGVRRVAFDFGVHDAAWQNGNYSNGACFAVSAAVADGRTIPLWERCLRPLTETADRGTQNARVTLPSGVAEAAGAKLIFATACIENCNWAWSYWSRVDPQEK